jgi:hypothetical protein
LAIERNAHGVECGRWMVLVAQTEISGSESSNSRKSLTDTNYDIFSPGRAVLI